MKRLTQLIIIAAVLLPMVVGAVPQNVTYTWTAPTTGSPAVSYEVFRSLDNGTTWTLYATPTAPSAVVVAPDLTPIIVRVRAVDALGRKGMYSESSDPYTNDPGPPGACSKPARQP
jgi:hypothetical protein